jgi:hypothetical protein
MPTLAPGETVDTREAAFEIDAGLPPGRYRYQLVVEDDHAVASEPVEHVVTIRRGRPIPPTPPVPVRPIP